MNFLRCSCLTTKTGNSRYSQRFTTIHFIKMNLILRRYDIGETRESAKVLLTFKCPISNTSAPMVLLFSFESCR